MNYIKLLNAAFEKFYFDDRLNPTHISLYMALFHEWNSHRFTSEFYVNRRDLMRVAKIGSKSTYHRCVTDLDLWKYVTYYPSNNPYKGSKIKMAIIETTDEPDMGQYDPVLEQLAEQYHPIREPLMDQHRPTNGQPLYQHRPAAGQALVSNINNTKHANINKQPKGRQAVLNFFIEKGFNAEEGKKFFAHYERNGWKTNDGSHVPDWYTLAIHWMKRVESSPKEAKPENNQEVSRKQDYLRTNKIKDYGQPL